MCLVLARWSVRCLLSLHKERLIAVWMYTVHVCVSKNLIDPERDGQLIGISEVRDLILEHCSSFHC